MFFCACAEEIGQVKSFLGECSLKVTHPDGECSRILVSNAVSLTNIGNQSVSQLCNQYYIMYVVHSVVNQPCSQ